MSVNYHAFQCRGFLFDEYEAHKEHWLAFFQNYDPRRVVHILGLTADEEYLYLSYYQTPYRMRLADGTLEKKTGGEWSRRLYFNEAMVCYHLLHYVLSWTALSPGRSPSMIRCSPPSSSVSQEERLSLKRSADGWAA